MRESGKGWINRVNDFDCTEKVRRVEKELGYVK
jgi:hypothetical protein